MRFKRITAAFDDDARERLCQSSGSEHSAANSVTDLSDLVNSFFEGDSGDHRGKSYVEKNNKTEYEEKVESFYGKDCDTKEMLMKLIAGGADDVDNRAKREIYVVVELVCRNLKNLPAEGFKRDLMSLLRQRGFDAGLCKSRWEKTGRHQAGEYKYIDVLFSGNRYIVEVSFGAEFTIARPTKTYQSLLEIIPKITIIKPSDLKKLVRLMCAAMTVSLKSREILVSPWRKNGYMQMKWFGSYKRTTNSLPRSTEVGDGDGDGGFNAMKIVKNRLRNRMEDDFLSDNLLLYIEKEIAETFTLDSFLNDFNDLRERRVQLQL